MVQEKASVFSDLLDNLWLMIAKDTDVGEVSYILKLVYMSKDFNRLIRL